MSEHDRYPSKKNRQDRQDRDDFWDVDRLVPERREKGVIRRQRATPAAVEIEIPPSHRRPSQGIAANTPLTVTPPPRRDPVPTVEPEPPITIDDILPRPEDAHEPIASAPLPRGTIRRPRPLHGAPTDTPAAPRPQTAPTSAPTSDISLTPTQPSSTPNPTRSPASPLPSTAPEAPEVHYIPPHTAEEGAGDAPLLDYRPAGVLLHRVQVFAWSSGFHYFDQFASEAADYATRETPAEAQRVSFFSYFPQYVQMNRRQSTWYLWWREQTRKGSYPDTDYAYILLYLFELINTDVADRLVAREQRDAMASVWMAYRRAYPQLDRYMCEWLCDYCLIHELPAPLDILAPALDDIIMGSRLKEFYLVSVILPTTHAPENETEDDRQAGRNLLTARILMRHCCQYDYHKSKFATGEYKALFDRTIPAAVAATLPLLLGSEDHPPAITMQDSTVTRDAFTGALCSYRFKRKITVSYTSFSRSHDLRFLIGDMVKHVENTLRSWIGVRSKLSVMSLPIPLRDALDAYLAPLAPQTEAIPKKKKEPERPAYEALYDLPEKELSLADAAAIEASSWETTRILTEAFGEPSEFEMPHSESENEALASASRQEAAPPPPPSPAEDTHDDILPAPDAIPSSPLAAALGDHLTFLRAALAGDRAAQRAYADSVRKMPDAVADEINAITTDIEILDMVLENDGSGFYAVIEDYRDILESI